MSGPRLNPPRANINATRRIWGENSGNRAQIRVVARRFDTDMATAGVEAYFSRVTVTTLRDDLPEMLGVKLAPLLA